MRKFTVKRRPRRSLGRQPGHFHPYLEILECRAQPGSVLSAAPNLVGSAALDPNAGFELTTSGIGEDLPAPHRLAPDSDLSTHVPPAGQEESSIRETAPRQAAPDVAPIPTRAPSSLSIQDQARAVSAQGGRQAGPAHPAYTLNTSSVASPAQGATHGQPSTQSQHNLSYQATALAAAGFRTLAASRSPQGLHLQPISNVKVVALGNHRAPPPAVNPIYVSYVGTADGNSQVNGFRANPIGDGSAFATGYLTDPDTGAQDTYVAKISADGTSDQLLIVGDSSGANNWQGYAVDAGSDGAVYVAGTITAVDNSQSQMFIMRIEGDVQTVDWMISPTLGGTFDQGKGVRIGTDPTLGECLYATGAFQDATNANAELAAVRLSNLGPDPTQLQMDGGGFVFRDPHGAPANTPGNSIAVDARGNMLIAASLGYNDGSDRTAMAVGVPADFSAAYGRALPFNTNGPTNGVYNSVDVDANGETYLAGQSSVISQQGDAHLTLLVSAFTFNGRTFTRIYDTLWTLSADGTINWVASGNKAIPGGNGAQAVNTTVNDPSDPSGIVILFRVSPDGMSSLDFNFVPTGGSSDDESTALDIQPDPFGGNDYYMAGYTNSTDFLTTPGAFQPSDPDPSGTFYEGWVAAVQITPF